MPLTGAELAKRFREKKQVERVKKIQKNIRCLDDEEKEKKRMQWRKQKQTQRDNKTKHKPKIQKIETREIKVNQTLKKKLRRVNNLLAKSMKYEERLKSIVGRLRKRLQRTKSALESKGEDLKRLEVKVQDLEVDRKKFLQSFQETYKENYKTQERKRLLKKLYIIINRKLTKNIIVKNV